MDKDKKKLYLIMGGFIAVIVLIIIIVCLFFLFQKHSLSYEDMETKLVESAKKYYESHGELLPKEDKEEVTVEASTLISEELLDTFASMTNDEETNCGGHVIVSKNSNQYIYTPYLTCGEDYHTTTLAEHIISTVGELDSTKSGLYEWNGEYVFRGEWPHNIVKINDNYWRIVKVDKNDEIVLLYADEVKKSDRISWDDRYNMDSEKNVGVNDYSMSRVRDYLEDYYDTYFTDDLKKNIVNYDICIGKRSYEDTTFDGVKECSETYSDKIGLLAVYDYYSVSLDSNCRIGELTCQNYNYLYRLFPSSWWTVTGSSLNSYWVYLVEKGAVFAEEAYTRAEVRPVIHLNRNFIYKGGSGTGDDPYVIE